MASRQRKTAAGKPPVPPPTIVAPPEEKEPTKQSLDVERPPPPEKERSDSSLNSSTSLRVRKRSDSINRPEWDRKLSIVTKLGTLETWGQSSSKYAVEEAIPEEWQNLQELLACRHNFMAITHPEETEEWKYLRVKDNVKNWLTILASVSEDAEVIAEESRMWMPEENHGFVEVELLDKQDKMTKVRYKSNEFNVPTQVLQEPNPYAYDGCEDMAMLSYLNDASVLHNLRERFKHNLIHTYSGLFCITVNPWRWLPIYSPKVVLMYKGQATNTMPPHVYAIADKVYNNMLEGQEDQSILITGESGAGKTENTKKMIQYFTIVGAQKREADFISLEEQICESNPVLEAFGNAKSAKNDNSSRFGKFVRICFTPNGKINRATIESYLLEKSRIVAQARNERSYHIFYQLLSTACPLELREFLHLVKTPNEYRFLSQGMSAIEGVDDATEMEHTERAMYVLNFTNDERLNMYKQVAAVLIMGEMKFKNKARNSEQAAIEQMPEPEAVCDLMGLDPKDFVASLLEPKVLVRGELVKQGKTVTQVNFSVGALAKSVYEKMFRWLVRRVNQTLCGAENKNMPMQKIWHFIGILDIAGFEIFEINSFEQLCINYTNEKLQYFFNHTMFIREQDEYRMEGLKWEMMDFALDLKPTIDLIEMKMGILSMLEEECIMPKGNEKTYVEKLMDQHIKNKPSPAFGRPKGGAKVDAHFSVAHYAGVVNYNVVGWLDKNKDPLNSNVVDLFKASQNALVSEIWVQYGGGDDNKQAKGQRRGSMAFMTVSTMFKEQLLNLVAILNSTHPHFVRCVVPNYERKPGILDGPLVLNQLRCNGVIEGLRIVARGFPNRLAYEEFRDRFRILSSERADWEKNPQNASINIVEDVGLHVGKDCELGQTKIFFRIGVLGRLELLRTAKLNQSITLFQAQIRTYNICYKWKALEKHAEFCMIIQRNILRWSKLQEWPWFKLLLSVVKSVHCSTKFLKQKMDLLQEANSDLQKKLDEALKQIEQEKRNAEQAAKNNKESEELRRQLEEERKARKKAETEEQKTRTRLDTVAENLETTKQENKKKDGEIERLKKLLEQSQNDSADNAKKAQEENERLRKQMEDQMADRDKKMRKMEEQMRNEQESHRKQVQELEKKQKKITEESNEKAVKEQKMSSLVDDLQEQLKKMDEMLRTKNTQIKENRDSNEKLMSLISELQRRVEQLESSLAQEKTEKRRIERSLNELRSDYEDLLEKVKKLTAKLEEQTRVNATQAEQIVKLNEQLSYEALMREESIRDLRDRHSALTSQLHEQIEQLHKKALKLESENLSIKAQLYNDNDSVERRRLTRSSSSLLAKVQEQTEWSAAESTTTQRTIGRRLSSGVDLVAQQIDDLEQERLELNRDKRMMRQEIEDHEKEQEKESQERSSMRKLLSTLRLDNGLLQRQLGNERKDKEQLKKEIRRLRTEQEKQEHRTTKLLIEKEAEVEGERARAILKITEAASESQEALSKASSLKRVCDLLHGELEEYRRSMRDAQYSTIRDTDASESPVSSPVASSDQQIFDGDAQYED